MDTEIFNISGVDNVIFSVNDISDVDIISSSNTKGSTPICVYLKVDTGMSRMGTVEENIVKIIKKIKKEKKILLSGIYSHFSSSDDLDSDMTEKQCKRFIDSVDCVKSYIDTIEDIHISNSAGILQNKGYELIWSGLVCHYMEFLRLENPMMGFVRL